MLGWLFTFSATQVNQERFTASEATELKNYIYILRDVIDPNLPLGLGEIPYSPLQVMHLEADISDLQQDTGFMPRYSFEKGIQETIEWCKHH